MEKHRKILLSLMVVAVLTKGEEIVEEQVPEELRTFSKPQLVIPVHSPSPIHHSHPPSHPPPHSSPSRPSSSSHPPSPPPVCKSYPDCNPVSANCCNCKNDLRGCCANGISATSQGYCYEDSCQSCVKSHGDCFHTNQCCGTASSCQNLKCCNELEASCTFDADCCQPVPANAVNGAQCKYPVDLDYDGEIEGTCTVCTKDGQKCTTDVTTCCGSSICGIKVGFSSDLDRLSICCLPPDEICIYGISQCCDSRTCAAGATLRYFCKPDPLKPALKDIAIQADKRGWGWNSSGQSSDHGTEPSGRTSMISKITGVCKACPVEGDPCLFQTDCCSGFKCTANKCTSNFLYQPKTTIDSDNMQRLDY